MTDLERVAGIADKRHSLKLKRVEFVMIICKAMVLGVYPMHCGQQGLMLRYKAGRLMNQLGLEVRFPKRFKVMTDSDHREAISPSKLNRYFDVFEPSKVWTTGITYIWTHEGWLCVAIVIDLFSKLVYG